MFSIIVLIAVVLLAWRVAPRERQARLRTEKARIAEVMAFLSRFTGRWLAAGAGSPGSLQTGPAASDTGRGG